MASKGAKLLIAAGLLSVAFGGAAAKLGEAAQHNDIARTQDAPDIHTAAGQERFLEVCASKPDPQTAAGQECKNVTTEQLRGVKPLKPVR